VSARLDALRASVERLERRVAALSDADLVAPAYPSEWTVADVLSHIGSSSVIWQRRLDDGLAGLATPEDFQMAVWAEWDAKPPRSKADDGIAADRRVLDRLLSLTDDDRARVRVTMGPIAFGFDDMVATRLNEHVLHTWDVEFAGDAGAVLPSDAVEEIIDNLALIARYTGRPTGASRTIVVRTTGPERVFSVTLTPEKVDFRRTEDADGCHVELPAEAFVRLVYGRFDPPEGPAATDDGAVADLRRVFPGP
jgi:uncharacterized protein (TIGR03083 family)